MKTEKIEVRLPAALIAELTEIVRAQHKENQIPNNCYCDQMGLGDPTQTCGDCPEDYKRARVFSPGSAIEQDGVNYGHQEIHEAAQATAGEAVNQERESGQAEARIAGRSNGECPPQATAINAP